MKLLTLAGSTQNQIWIEFIQFLCKSAIYTFFTKTGLQCIREVVYNQVYKKEKVLKDLSRFKQTDMSGQCCRHSLFKEG